MFVYKFNDVVKLCQILSVFLTYDHLFCETPLSRVSRAIPDVLLPKKLMNYDLLVTMKVRRRRDHILAFSIHVEQGLGIV